MAKGHHYALTFVRSLILSICLIGVHFTLLQNTIHANPAITTGYRLTIQAIEKLAEIGLKQGAPTVGKELGKLAAEVPALHRVAFLERAYAGILLRQGRITAHQADEFMRNLTGVPGFSSAMSKACGMSEAKVTGHGFELLVANAFKKSGFKIIEIGKKFNDPVKRFTDIDLIVTKNGKIFVFELKNYKSTSVSIESIPSFRADMDSLVAFTKEIRNSDAFFVMSNKPTDKTIEKILEVTAKQRGVNIVYATEEQLPRIVTLFGVK